MKISIIYWSETGNTEKMADLISQGIKSQAKDIDLNVKAVGRSTSKDIIESDLLLLGCPAMGAEEIDTSEMEPFIEANRESFLNKDIGLFGSYGWGDGQWIEDWRSTMEAMKANIKIDNLIVNETPEGESEDECILYGSNLAKLYM